MHSLELLEVGKGTLGINGYEKLFGGASLMKDKVDDHP